MGKTRRRARHKQILATASALGIAVRGRPIESVYREVNRLKTRAQR